ncbi:helix-turn-helix transcriptional regulator [Streptomyces cellulosae]
MRTVKHTPQTTTPSTPLDPERELAYAIASAIQELRLERGLSQKELAELVGTKQPRISVVESATKLPSLPLLLRIAAALDMNLAVVFENKETNAQP